MRYFIVNYRRIMVRKGFLMEPQTDEIVSVSKKLKMRDLQSAAVILDFQKQQVVQASMDGTTVPKDWWKIRNFYHQHYQKLIEDLESFHGLKVVEDVPAESSTEPVSN